MSESPKPGSWWQTLPGLLTALAATITALSGFVALLFQNGILGHKSEPKAEVVATTASQGAAPASAPSPAVKPTPDPSPAAQTSPAQDAKARRPWSDAEAVLLGRDGKTTRLRAETFCSCISVNHEIELDGNQSIPFEKMASIEVLQADENTVPNAKAKLKLTLVDGTELSGSVAADCDLFGYNNVGRFTTFYHRLRSVRFE